MIKAQSRTNQEAFDHVVRHMHKQKVKSSAERVPGDGDPQCRYVGENGTTCALGCLFDDPSVLASFEGKNGAHLAGMLFVDFGIPISFAAAVQDAHDSAPDGDESFLPYFADRMRKVAKEFKLSTSVLDSLVSE